MKGFLEWASSFMWHRCISICPACNYTLSLVVVGRGGQRSLQHLSSKQALRLESLTQHRGHRSIKADDQPQKLGFLQPFLGLQTTTVLISSAGKGISTWLV